MQRLAHERARAELPVEIKTAEVDTLLFASTTLGLDHLAHPLAGGVIHVKCLSASAQIHLVQLVLEVPFHLHRVDSCHAAVNIVTMRICVGVGLNLVNAVANCCPRHAVTLLKSFNQAGCIVFVGSRPVASVGDMSYEL